MMGPMTTIWMIRHGESESNAGLATSDPAAITLTARGRVQAGYVAAAFPSPPALIVTSPFERAKETALPTRARYPDAVVEEWPIQEFTYLAPARCQNMIPAERAPMVRAYWELADPTHVDGAGAESFTAFLSRVEVARRRFQALGPGLVAVFTHGGFLRAMLRAEKTGTEDCTPSGMRHFRTSMQSFPIANAAIMKLRIDGNGRAVLGGVVASHLPAELITH
jgi:2,3-bisphosphoglycerate-dependent phosphoglycerate mutase